MEMVSLKFKGPEGEREIRDVAQVRRGESCQCPKVIAERIVSQDPDGWEIVKPEKKTER